MIVIQQDLSTLRGLMNSYFVYLFFGTFVLEDVALATAMTLVAEGKMSQSLAFWACFGGIAVGDVGIYLMGLAAQKINWLKRFKIYRSALEKINEFGEKASVAELIVISRFIPGTRVITYLLAGLTRYSFWKFNILTVISVAVWVGLMFFGGLALIQKLQQNWIVSVLVLLVLFAVIKKTILPLLNKWDRLVFINSWRKWTHFEFWPAWFFYIPFYFYYAYQSLKTRSFFTPFYVNPAVFNGGILGESKWDFLQYLDPKNPTTLNSVKINKNDSLEIIFKKFQKDQFKYPVILKPDVGQRGFAVRIIRNDEELKTYRSEAQFHLILQSLSQYACEAGLFYIRRPKENKGIIYSITDKKFPYVVGDGKSQLGDLIARDPRARKMLPTYFSRHKDQLDQIIPDQEKYFISECGNHCQGALFFNGRALITDQLTAVVDQISQRLPHFYFGRLDIRYKDSASLLKGLNFEIVEINGAGAEATHIWDPKTTLLEAYKSLFNQWDILFSIGYQLKHDRTLTHQVRIFSFFKESFKVYFRKGKLTTSS